MRKAARVALCVTLGYYLALATVTEIGPLALSVINWLLGLGAGFFIGLGVMTMADDAVRAKAPWKG